MDDLHTPTDNDGQTLLTHDTSDAGVKQVHVHRHQSCSNAVPTTLCDWTLLPLL